MNREAAQEAITEIVDTYRNEQPKRARNQYPASKTRMQQAEELGILDMIPNAPYSQTPGNTELKLILDAAQDDGSINATTADGEGVSGTPSALYQALNASDNDPDGNVDTEINIPKALIATNPTPAEFFDVIGATRSEWQAAQRGGWRAPGYLGTFREHGHSYFAVTVNERHFVIHETKHGQRYVYEFSSPAQCRGMLRIKKGNTDVETGAEFGHQRSPSAAKARLEENNDDGDDLYDEATDTTLTTVNAAEGHSHYDVSDFLLDEEVISEDEYDGGNLPDVNVYVVDGPMTVEFYLDRDKAVAAYNDIVDLFSGENDPATEKDWSEHIGRLFDKYDAYPVGVEGAQAVAEYEAAETESERANAKDKQSAIADKLKARGGVKQGDALFIPKGAMYKNNGNTWVFNEDCSVTVDSVDYNTVGIYGEYVFENRLYWLPKGAGVQWYTPDGDEVTLSYFVQD